jgi:hypothetical protein
VPGLQVDDQELNDTKSLRGWSTRRLTPTSKEPRWGFVSFSPMALAWGLSARPPFMNNPGQQSIPWRRTCSASSRNLRTFHALPA